jgi:hypothetical protein
VYFEQMMREPVGEIVEVGQVDPAQFFDHGAILLVMSMSKVVKEASFDMVASLGDRSENRTIVPYTGSDAEPNDRLTQTGLATLSSWH